MSSGLRLMAVMFLAAGCAAGSQGGPEAPHPGAPGTRTYQVQVDLKNLSGEDKTNWPVILRVYAVLGRNLDPGSINPDGFHVYDPAGREVPHMIERIPPYDQPGSDEIVFVIPRMKSGEVLSYRISNTPGKSDGRKRIDVVNSPHNLIADGGFETGKGEGAAGFGAPARRDTKVRHSGSASLMLTADGQTLSTKHAKAIALHKGSWYYFGVWSKTEGVCRYGHQAGSAAHFRIGGFIEPKPEKGKYYPSASVEPQCSTRDWLKTTMAYSLKTPWGMDVHAAKAVEARGGVEFVLQQRKHFYMDKGKTRGTWWLDDAVFVEQPEVRVRFDLAVKPLMRDGVFVFTRPALMQLGRLDEKKRGAPEWCTRPFPHEKLTALDGFALRGQRVSFCVGVYHARPVPDVVCRLAGGALAAGGQKLPVELIEYCPGFLGPDRRRYMDVLNSPDGVTPVTLLGDEGVRYFFLTFHVPADAKPGTYAGKVELLFEKDKLHQAYPLTLRVQDMVQPSPDDVFVGIIYQGGNPRFDDEGMTVYARSGFNSLTRFGNFLDFESDGKGGRQVDVAKLHRRMMWLKGYGMKAVAVFSDFDLGPKWNGGTLLKQVRPKEFNAGGRPWGERLKTAAQAWKAQIKRIEAARKQHPEWPVLIYMTWDEPSLGGGRNGKPDPAMAWVNEVAPDALTTLDVQFAPLPACMKWYTVPAFDDPANWAGPEVYRWVRQQGRQFGFCGAADIAEGARSQPGMMMISTGAKFFHAWHLTGGHTAGQVAYDRKTKKLLRAPAMINWGDGMNDLKAYTLLKDALKRAGKDPAKARAVRAAKDYLKAVFTVFNGDFQNSWTLRPHLGTPASWGYERFYDDWQEQMARHAAALSGVKWID